MIRISKDLRAAIADFCDLIREEYPGENAQGLLAGALRSRAVGMAIADQIYRKLDQPLAEDDA